MANKRLSELTELAAADIQSTDLFLVTDVSALESKKLQAVSLQNFILSNGALTGSITTAITANTASYIDPANVGLIASSSYAISSSRSEITNLALTANTASYIAAANVNGSVPSASYAGTSSYVNYRYQNGTIENSKTASLSTNSITASYLWYVPGVFNGTASYALSASNTVFNGTASYLNYTGVNNGTASYALTINLESTASYLRLVAGRANGTASYALTSSWADNAKTASRASFLVYSPLFSNGTASYCINSANAASATSATTAVNATTAVTAATSSLTTTASYAISASYATTARNCTGTASYANVAASISSSAFYKIYGPYTADSQTTTEAYVQNFVINTQTGTGKTVIIQAMGDIKVPLTTTNIETNVYLFTHDTTPSAEWSSALDSCVVSNFASCSAGILISGQNKQSFALQGSYNLSGSWNRFKVTVDGGGALIDTRTVKFLVYTAADSFTKTAYPPY